MENQQDEGLFLLPEMDEIENNSKPSTEDQKYTGTKRQQKRKAREDVWNQTKEKRKQETKVQI